MEKQKKPSHVAAGHMKWSYRQFPTAGPGAWSPSNQASQWLPSRRDPSSLMPPSPTDGRKTAAVENMLLIIDTVATRRAVPDTPNHSSKFYWA